MQKPVLEFEHVGRTYPGAAEVLALRDVSFRLDQGGFASLIGPSGSGKTTLLNIASGLDRPSTGHVRIEGTDLATLSTHELSRFRSRKIGFVFQSHNLFPVLTALENVEYTSLIRGDSGAQARSRALRALESVGLSDKLHALPGQLSGGQQQRVAVARSLATEPAIIFADEPTASLDSTTAIQLIDLFERMNREYGTTFLFSTHDSRLSDRVRQRFEVRDGNLRPD